MNTSHIIVDATGNEFEVNYRGEILQPIDIATAGAIPVNASNVRIKTTGAIALTLADGLFDGQRMTISMIVDGGTATLTPANYLNGATIAFADAFDTVQLEWVAGTTEGWLLLSKNMTA